MAEHSFTRRGFPLGLREVHEHHTIEDLNGEGCELTLVAHQPPFWQPVAPEVHRAGEDSFMEAAARQRRVLVEATVLECHYGIAYPGHEGAPVADRHTAIGWKVSELSCLHPNFAPPQSSLTTTALASVKNS